MCVFTGIGMVADLPGVGQGLHNHISVSVPILLTKVKSYNRLNVSTLTDFVFNRQGALTSTAMSQVHKSEGITTYLLM